MSSNSNWNMESFDPVPLAVNPDSIEEFEEVPLPPAPKADQLGSEESEEDEREATQWSTKPLSRFQVDVPEGADDDLDVGLNEVDLAPLAPAPPTVKPKSNPEPQPKTQTATQQISLSHGELQKLVNDQARAIIESIAWKVVPDLATQIIERELKRLLTEKDSTPSP